jgi:DNA-binding transcriptional regulator YiaG
MSPSPAELRAARKAAGLTQTAAAGLIYCRLRTWQEWEAGTTPMHPALWELWQLKVCAPAARS